MKIEKIHQEKLKELKQFFVFYGHCHVPKNEPFLDLYEWTERLRQSRNRLSEALVEELDGLGFYWGMFGTNELLWQFRYSQLKIYKQKNGHTKVTDSENLELGRWVKAQRAEEKRMRPERKRLLDELNFLWSADLKKQVEDKWKSKYSALKEFQKEHGHTAVPKKRGQSGDLGEWVVVQRAFEHKMSATRKELLDAIGFLWNKDLPAFRNKQWDEWYDKFVEFKEKEGHVNPRAHVESETELGTWVQRQRKAKKLGKLDERKLKKLEAIGFEWSSDIKQKEFRKWLSNYEELRKYKVTYGHCQIPQQRDKNLKNNNEKMLAKLGEWVNRQLYRSKRLSQQQIDLLNAIDFEWKRDKEIKKAEDWEYQYNQLVDYFKENGHSKVPAHYAPNRTLGSWVYRQRKNEAKLTAGQKAKLDKLNFVWRGNLKEKKAQKFEEKFRQLQLFYEKNGHFDVFQNPKEHSKLGIWLNHLRRGNLKLTQAQKKQLAAIGFNWEETPTTRRRVKWMSQYHNLVRFKEKYGHTNVTRSSGNHSLHSWVQTQRSTRHTMPSWRIKLLDEIGFVWSRKQMEDSLWQEKYEELLAFKEQFDHTRVSERWADGRLGRWVGRMRHKKDQLDSDKLEKLNLINFDWRI
ncbi:MAG: helicase associated domain-containing protein [Bacteroidota bacterium]